MRSVFKPLAILLALGLPAVALADGQDNAKRCDMLARKASGHTPGLIPPIRLGAVTLKITGSVAFGVDSQRGAIATTSARGADARDFDRDRKEAEYTRYYNECLTGR
ncbi:MAG: hypothetical protein KDK24_03390 [Pseudooceanicola sp.]|nr:hypothetical protein [Pseudooceanicola sp.]